MGSGNFIVGDGLSLEAFRQYVEPILSKKGIAVADISPGQEFLISLTGKSNLEEALNQSLIEAASNAEAEYTAARKRGIRGDEHKKVWEHQFMGRDRSYPNGPEKASVITTRGKFTVIGVYAQDKAASGIFPSLALKYAAKDAQKELEKLAEKATDVFRKFVKD